MSDLSLTERIRLEAMRLGFFRMGVAAAGPLPWSQEFVEWLAAGNHGAMDYLVRQSSKRQNPSLVFADVRSIVTLAMNYFTESRLSGNPLTGRISRYACGEDYHFMIQDRLRSLLAFIAKKAPDARGVFYADTGPVMEKVWGAHSALGWMGKHSNLISREKGSWFFIGTLLLNLELDADPPSQDRCGTCSRCLSACPTGAILRPYVVDARLCISYLTIEWKGPIPRPLRPAIGNRIFGCDDCQDVCPWNRFAVKTMEEAFQTGESEKLLNLPEMVTMTREEFVERFHGSPIRRIKRDGFVRNVALALGNSLRTDAVPALTGALTDSSAIVRGHAAWALGRIGGRASAEALVTARNDERDPYVQEEIDDALVRIEP